MAKRLITIAIAVTALSSVAQAGGSDSAVEDAGLVQQGRLVYQQNCASCHGVNAEGAHDWQRPNALGEIPAPPHDATGHTWKHSDGMLYRIVREGWRDPFNKSQRLTMPAFKAVLSPAQTRAVIAYLKTLWTPEQQRFQREESQRMPFPPEAQ